MAGQLKCALKPGAAALMLCPPETNTRTRLDTAGRNNAILKMFYGTSPATYFEHVIGSDMRLH